MILRDIHSDIKTWPRILKRIERDSYSSHIFGWDSTHFQISVKDLDLIIYFKM